ncbi:Hypothetical protein D9617_10g075060 [Elsinoe fawcettii]|nr:Hypothetical protein D9617_10g075060 [Elsinoe fawcettii]
MAQAGRDKFEVVCRIAQDSIPYFSEKISFSGQYDSDEDRHTVTVANATGDEFYRATIRKLDSIDRATCFLQEHVQYQNERVMSAFADFANNFYRWRMAERPENWIRREILSNHSKFTVLVRTMRYVLIGTEAGDDGGRKTRIDDLWAADAAFFRTFGRHLALRHLIQKKYGKTEKYIMDDDDLDQHIANGFSEPATSTRDSSNVFDERPSRSHPTSPISPVPQPPRMHQTTQP